MNGFRFTERDKVVFREFFEHGFLTARQFVGLGHFPNEKKCRDRLRLLNKEGYIDFCEKPGFRQGRAEYVYYLNKRKLAEITQLSECASDEVCIAKPNYSPMLLHHLAIIDFCICVRNACKETGEYETLLIPEYKRWKGKSDKLKKSTSQNIVFKGENLEVIPDAVMCLSRVKDKLRSLIFVEIYRGTQTIDGSRNSIRQKLEAYVAYWEQKTYERFSRILSYPFKGFRVMILVHSVSHFEKLKALCQKVAHGLFWLALVDNITPNTFFGPVWCVSGEGEPKSLVKGME